MFHLLTMARTTVTALPFFRLPREYYCVYSSKEPSPRTDRTYRFSDSLASAQANARRLLEQGLSVFVIGMPENEILFDSANGVGWLVGETAWDGSRSRTSLLATPGTSRRALACGGER